MCRNTRQSAPFWEALILSLLVWFAPTIGVSGDAYVAEFLDLPVDARSVTFGVNVIVLDKQAASVFANPANVVWGNVSQIQFTYGSLYGGFSSGLAAHQGFFARVPLKGGAGLGLAIVRFAVDDIPRYGALGSASFAERLEGAAELPISTPLGTFSDNEIALVAAFGRSFPLHLALNWFVEKIDLFPYVGVDFKMLFQSLDRFSAHGVGFDAGVGMKVDLRQFSDVWWLGRMNLAWVGRDLGNTTLIWNNRARQSRFYSWTWGFSYQLTVAGSVETGWYWQQAPGRDLPGALGLEFGCRSLRILLGMRERRLGFAFGIEFRRLSLGYGVGNAALGETRRFDVTWSF